MKEKSYFDSQMDFFGQMLLLLIIGCDKVKATPHQDKYAFFFLRMDKYAR